MGRFDADGYLYYVKRKPEKELIKPGGENVYPAEVETVIMQMEGVSGVCVYGVPDARWGEAIKAVVEVRPPGGTPASRSTDFVASRIARFKRPHRRGVHGRLAAHRRRRQSTAMPSRRSGAEGRLL